MATSGGDSWSSWCVPGWSSCQRPRPTPAAGRWTGIDTLGLSLSPQIIIIVMIICVVLLLAVTLQWCFGALVCAAGSCSDAYPNVLPHAGSTGASPFPVCALSLDHLLDLSCLAGKALAGSPFVAVQPEGTSSPCR